jgi:hypothetical protein
MKEMKQQRIGHHSVIEVTVQGGSIEFSYYIAGLCNFTRSPELTRYNLKIIDEAESETRILIYTKGISSLQLTTDNKQVGEFTIESSIRETLYFRPAL